MVPINLVTKAEQILCNLFTCNDSILKSRLLTENELLKEICISEFAWYLEAQKGIILLSKLCYEFLPPHTVFWGIVPPKVKYGSPSVNI